MKAATLIFFLLFVSISSSWAQACFDVTIETTPLIILPECNDTSGSVLFSNTRGGRPPYTFRFNGGTNQFGSFSKLTVGKYELTITDSRGCSDTFNIDMTYDELDEIIIPDNAFTPNDDGFNDTWYIPGIESFAGTEVIVFNRWGQKVHNNSQYANSNGWDGRSNGLRLPTGTYFYIIEITNNCLDEQIHGTVNIIR